MVNTALFLKRNARRAIKSRISASSIGRAARAQMFVRRGAKSRTAYVAARRFPAVLRAGPVAKRYTGAVRTYKRGRFRKMKKKSTKLSRALALVQPVKWTNVTSVTSDPSRNNLANRQNVMGICTTNSPEDLQSILAQHAVLPANTVNGVRKLHVLHASAHLSLTNFDAADTHVIIYRVTPKGRQAVPTAIGDPLSIWYNATTGASAQYTEGNTQAPLQSNDDIYNFGMRPESEPYTQVYYTWKRFTEIDLPSGGTYELSIPSEKPFSVMPVQVLPGAIAAQKTTIFWIAISYTKPMVALTNNVTSVSSGKIGVMVREVYVSKMLDHSPQLNINTNGVLAAVGGLRFIADALDAPAVDVAA